MPRTGDIREDTVGEENGTEAGCACIAASPPLTEQASYPAAAL